MEAEKTISIEDGKKIAYRVVGVGSKPIIVFLSGSVFNYKQFDPVFLQEIKKLLPDYSFLFYNYIGIGNSSPLAGDFDFIKIAKQHIALLDALGIESAHHFGYSKGAVIGLLAAVFGPKRIKSLATYGTPNLAEGNNEITKSQYSKRIQHLRSITGIWEKQVDDNTYKLLYDTFYVPVIFNQDVNHLSFKNKIKSRNIRKALKPMLMGTLIHNIVKLFEYYQREITEEEKQNYMEKMKQIDLPVLLMHGVLDSLIPLDTAKALGKMIQNSKFIEFEELGHTSPLLDGGEGKKIMQNYAKFIHEL
ncbi:MAG: alpha/beta hydrolase [Candidatus Heimdallarchaeota archaeon]|nr:alpha/beta hydrolase [Candidatus Heimdallarchaeota archaeon]